MTRPWPVVLVFAVLAAPLNLAQTPDSALPIDIVVPSTPIPVRGAGALHLFYELHLTNFRAVTLELMRVEVHAGDGRSLESYGETEISDLLIRPGMPADLPNKRVHRRRPSRDPHAAPAPRRQSPGPGAEGVPFNFESMQFRGSVASLDKLLGDEPWIPQGGTVVRTREIPLENAVVRFP